MQRLRLAITLGLASLPSFARIAPAQAPTAALSGRPVPDLATRQTPPRDARILYNLGQLQVIADNSSLNLTLLQIAHAAGIRVSGTAPEERIFGTYGPAPPAVVLRILLQGTGTNMLVTQSSASAPAELVLTPRNGPATPPSVHPAIMNQPLAPVASGIPAQPAPGADPTSASRGTGQTEPDVNMAEPVAAPVPLTPAERALLVDRLQQQQRQAARAQ